MNCEFEHCVYNRNSECVLNGRIEINAFGMCDSCILVSLDADFLSREKERQLQQMDEQRDDTKK